MLASMSILPPPHLLETWGLTAPELSEILLENPSMRGLVFGFVAEYKLGRDWLHQPGIDNLERPSSHDRKKKYDFGFDYKGIPIKLEVKCLDTPKVKIIPAGYKGTFQCNASDKTAVTLGSGEVVNTNCLAVGGFDVLAVCLFAFGSTWNFGFALNEDLPRTTYRKYTASQQSYLLKSSMNITWPLLPPFTTDLFAVLNRLVSRRSGS